MKSEFTPTPGTAKVCLQVLRAAVVGIEKNRPGAVFEKIEE
jgi:hypothetical protein